ncbi:MAG: RNA-guided endonuclease InsQ/TnpB family protein [Anaerocolumna sp.]
MNYNTKYDIVKYDIEQGEMATFVGATITNSDFADDANNEDIVYEQKFDDTGNIVYETKLPKPCRIVIEDLNVKGMMKNKHLSDSIRKQSFYEFRRQLEYKSKFRGIELVIADRFYPSSKTCSLCGNIKKDLKLKDRVYNCECGFTIDRDLNASINLSRYKLA